MKAELYIQNLQKAIGDLCAQYINESVMQSLEYAIRPYGVMQYEELKEISVALAALKEQLNSLSDECVSIPQSICENTLDSSDIGNLTYIKEIAT